ncbi:MAG: hypothetical protein BWX88_04546 [Planctomycetes bacterium ADurb.Bin126]|nr:MAG: hypothetical protein BWX88_04546 [Planctomycetes bacterium ADurb.Bin126]HOD82906.1 hypothetical protein [Phycisphaerae bacterium]HQL73758.1 hypothetical protein [Phycisphaerae bacterium]
MNGHMRIWTFLGLCGWLVVAGGAGLEKDFEMLFGGDAAGEDTRVRHACGGWAFFFAWLG